MKDLKITVVNYKEICISDKFKGSFQVTVYDTERQETTYRNYFKTIQKAIECFEHLISIQKEKLSYQF